MEKNNQILETNGKGNAGFMNFIKKYVEEVLILENIPDQ